MQKSFKKLRLFHWMLIGVFSSAILVACTSNDEVKTEKSETVIEQKDSLPPLDTDSSSTTRPESIKNQ